MKTTLRKLGLALAATAAFVPAQAGVLTFQDVVFTSSWTGNVLRLEIDAARPGGNWAQATTLGAVGIKGIGAFDSVSLTAAPGGAAAWKLSAAELDSKGCKGNSNKNADTKLLCLSGGKAQLADNMVFSFAFTGGAGLDLDEPHLKVNFLNSSGNQIGNLLSLALPASPVVILPPGTPVTPPVVTPPVVTPPVVTPPVVTPPVVTPPVVTPPVVTPPVVTPPVVTPPVVTPPVVTPPVVTPPVVTPPVITPPVVTPPVKEPVVTTPPSSEQDTNEVPEPRTVTLMLAGLALMGMALRKRS